MQLVHTWWALTPVKSLSEEVDSTMDQRAQCKRTFLIVRKINQDVNIWFLVNFASLPVFTVYSLFMYMWCVLSTLYTAFCGFWGCSGLWKVIDRKEKKHRCVPYLPCGSCSHTNGRHENGGSLRGVNVWRRLYQDIVSYRQTSDVV